MHPLEVGGRVEPTLGHQHAVLRHHRRQLLRHRKVNLQGFEITVIYPNQLGAKAERPRHLRSIVHLDQDIHAEIEGEGFQLRRFRVLERGHDQQDAIGADRARLEHLVGVEHEILAQCRQPDRAARLFQERILALEIRLVGQHRQAGRAARLIGAGEGRRIEVSADQPLGGRGALDLRDQAEAAGADHALQLGAEAARRVGAVARLRRCAHLG